MIYPKTYDKCPACGSTQRLVAEEMADKLKPNQKAAILVTQTPLINNDLVTKIIATRPVKVLVGLFDVCAECGLLYCFEAQIQQAILSNQQPPPQMRQN